MEPRTFSVAQVAKILGAHPQSVRRWIAAGKLKAAKLKEWRISALDLERFYRECGGGRLIAELEDGESEKVG